MLTAEQIQSLKKVNLTKDAEKTKVRVKEDFKSTSDSNKKEIVELSGLRRTAFYKVFDTGSISAKVALSMAQVLDVSPYYYTGAEDVKEPCTNEVIIDFLVTHGYKEFAADKEKPKRKYNRKPKVEPQTVLQPESEPLPDLQPEAEPQIENDNSPIITTPDVEAAAEPVVTGHITVDTVNSLKTLDDTATFNVILNNSPEMQKAATGLDEESAVLLLRALIKKAEISASAKTLCELINRCLLS